MKQEIQLLLDSECESLDINEFFILRRWKHDSRMFPVDMLRLELRGSKPCSKIISSRDVKGIMEEVEEAMKEIMNKRINDMQRKLRGGLIGRYI